MGLDDLEGERPWATDGTASGTEVITHEYPGMGVGEFFSGNFLGIRGTAYIILAIESYYPSWSLFKSDGTASTTKEILHNPKETDEVTILDLTNAGGILYFVNVEKNSNGGQSLYSYDESNGLKFYDFFPDRNDQASILLANKSNVFLSLNGTDVGQEPYVIPTLKVTEKDMMHEIKDDGFTIYPNPSWGTVIIHNNISDKKNGATEIIISDFSGKNVFDQSVPTNGDNDIYLSLADNLTNGLYVMEIKTGTSCTKKLFEVQK